MLSTLSMRSAEFKRNFDRLKCGKSFNTEIRIRSLWKPEVVYTLNFISYV